MEDERRNANCRQYVPDVDLLVHAVERFERARTRPKPDHVDERAHLVLVELAEGAYRLARPFPRTEDL